MLNDLCCIFFTLGSVAAFACGPTTPIYVALKLLPCTFSTELEHARCAMQIHAEGEAEHAAIGHDAVLSFVPADHEDTLRRAMHDHDRDFSVFYNKLADMLQ